MALKNLCHGTVLITRRLGRDEHGDRNPYLSARSLLLAEEGEDLSWMDLLSAMRACCKNFATDAPQLWLRLLFTGLINADLSLRKIVFLCSGQGRWRLAPATGFRQAMQPGIPAVPFVTPGPRLPCDVDQLIRLSAAFKVPHGCARAFFF